MDVARLDANGDFVLFLDADGFVDAQRTRIGVGAAANATMELLGERERKKRNVEKIKV